jgi:uncharacterized protein YkwD
MALCCFFLPLAGYGQSNLNEMKTEVLRLVNEHRAKLHLAPLVSTPAIEKEAEKHSQNMAAKKTSFGHDGFDDRIDRLNKQIKYSSGSAENVAFGPVTAQKAVALWLKSDGHRKNIEGDFNLTGLGIARSTKGEIYYTQIFIKTESPQQGVSLTALQKDIHVLINKYRTDNGLKPLKNNQDIEKEAIGHSQNMASGKVPFGHNGFENRSHRLEKKIPDMAGIAENVAGGPITADEVVKLWLNSPNHRKNIMGDFNLSGIGVAETASGKIYYTQIFVKN